jgi:hypothetical protein
MYTSVLRALHENNKAILNYLADADNSVELAIHIERSNKNFTKSSKIDENIFVWINNATQYKINLLQKFFALYGEDPENLVFLIREGAAANDDEAGRFSLRQNFLTQAIPAIRSATGTFNYVNPTTSNTIQGASGCAGVYYNCVANYDNAWVELYISSPAKAVNKAVFDALEKQRDEIINEYASELTWDRMDDNSASKIYDQLNGVSITNEADWPRMTAFLSDRAAKLKDAFQNRLDAAYAAAQKW